MRKKLMAGGVFVLLVLAISCSSPFSPTGKDYDEDESDGKGGPKAPTISLQPRDTGYTYDTADKAAALTVTASVSKGELSYQWYSSSLPTDKTGRAIESATKASYTLTADEIAKISGPSYYYVVVTNTLNKKTAQTVSRIVRVTVNAKTPQIERALILTPDKTDVDGGYTEGETVTITANVTPNSGDHGTLTYKWYQREYGATDVTEVVGAGSEGNVTSGQINFQPDTSQRGVTYYYVEVTNTIEDNGDGGTKTATAKSDEKAINVGITFVKITGLTAADKVYDGTTAAAVSIAGATLTGIGGDIVYITPGTARFADSYDGADDGKNAGENKLVILNNDWELDGTDADKYCLHPTDPLAEAVRAAITKRPLYITGTSGTGTKEYDGETVYTTSLETGAGIILGTLDSPGLYDGIVSGESLTVKIGDTSYYNSPNVATADEITIVYGITAGANTLAANYNPPADDTVTGVIEKRVLAISPSGTGTKVYDGGTDYLATGTGITLGSFGNVVSGESLTPKINSAAYNNANVASANEITIVYDFDTVGPITANYQLPSSSTVGGEITPKELTLSIGYSGPAIALSPLPDEDSVEVTVTVSGFIPSESTNNKRKYTSDIGLTLDDTATTATLTYDGTTAFSSPFKFTSVDSNYEATATLPSNITVHDGLDKSNPILVTQTNVKVFNEYANTTDGLKRHYKLYQDIVLDAPIMPDTSNWTAIGTDTNRFTGSFDGDNHTITNLTIDNTGITDETADYQGMFGRIIDINSVVQNVGLININIKSNRNDIGGVAGRIDYGTVQNCYVTGEVSGGSDVGGVVGVNYGTVQNCYTTCNVEGLNSISSAGGVVGGNASIVQNCYATGNVTGKFGVGGVMGSGSGRVQNCYATGNVNGNIRVGGVGGQVDMYMQNCVALNSSIIQDNVNGSYIGRVAGINEQGRVLNNYARDSGMTMTYNAGGTTYTPTPNIDDKDGANVASTGYNAESWWRTATNWKTTDGAFAWDFDNVWDWNSTTNLPILRNMPAGAQNPTVTP